MVARFDDDDFAGEDVAVLAAEDSVRRPLLLPKSARRLDAESLDLLAQMQERALQITELESQLEGLTRLGREVGISWSVLGFVQGLTGEAVRRRLTEEP
jgi:hypothetical protein